MKIKTRIISYTFFSCFIVISALSAFIYKEMKELIIHTLDSNAAMVEKSILQLVREENKPASDTIAEDEYSDIYIRMTYKGEIYQSEMSKGFLPPKAEKDKFVTTLYPLSGNDYKSKSFRFVSYKAEYEGDNINLLVGIPLDHVEEELNELFVSILITTIISIAVISLLGLFIANTILKPVQGIIKASGNINSRNMSERIKEPSTRDEIYDLTVTLNSLFDRLEKSFKPSERIHRRHFP